MDRTSGSTDSSSPGDVSGGRTTRISTRRRTPPLHPLLFGVYPVLALLARNYSQIPLNQTVRPFAAASGVTIAIWCVALLALRNLRKSAIITSVVVIGLFSYGQLVSFAAPPLAPLVGCIIFTVASIAILATAITKRPLYDTTAVFNLGALVLIAPSAWFVLISLLGAMRHPALADVTRQRNSESHTSGAPRKSVQIIKPYISDDPDIYYIILDAYGRADRLKQFYSYNNEPFLDALRKRGFYIAAKSAANYVQTPLCLASSLNMEYLESKTLDVSPEGLRHMVDESAVASFLESRGYRYVSIWSGLEVSRVTSADTVLNNYQDLNAFETQALNLTPIVANRQFRTQRYDSHRQRILGVFDCLDTVAQQQGPKFVFAHALAPHPPFVFGVHGEKVYPPGPLSLADGSWLLGRVTRSQYIQGYVSQLQYVNSRVLNAVDAILAQSARRPIIIIQGDHGSRMTLDWDSKERTDLREPFANLNAYLVPHSVSAGLYQTITPVNSFRVLFTRLFGSKLPLLTDRSFYSTAGNPTRFSDVTNLIMRAHGPSTPSAASALSGSSSSTLTSSSVESGER